MLSIAGVSLCLAGAVLVGFEERNEKLFFWLGGILFIAGSVADILDGALARAASKGTVFGAFLDSTFDRLGEAAMLTAIGLVVHARGQRDRARRDVPRGDRLVARQLHAREGGDARSARRCRLRLAPRAGRDHLRRSRDRAVGLAAVARSTSSPRWRGSPSVQRMWFVRRQLREIAEAVVLAQQLLDVLALWLLAKQTEQAFWSGCLLR